MSTLKSTPTRTLLKKECRKRGLPIDGNIKALFSRLCDNDADNKEQKKDTDSKTTLDQPDQPDRAVHPRLAMKKKKKKSSLVSKFTTEDNPFPSCYKATQFVTEKYGPVVKGDDIKVPEWRIHRHNTSNVEKTQLVLPRTRNTKGGMRLRWVLYNDKNL
tara:strand:- start:2582 stop:3058 length:477 start_codon:yes stop_codon:yes gene_type:complete